MDNPGGVHCARHGWPNLCSLPMQRTPAATTGRTVAARPSAGLRPAVAGSTYARHRRWHITAREPASRPFRIIEPIRTSPEGDDLTASAVSWPAFRGRTRRSIAAWRSRRSRSGASWRAGIDRMCRRRRHAGQAHALPRKRSGPRMARPRCSAGSSMPRGAPRSHRQTGHGRPRLASLTGPESLPSEGERMLLAASRCPSRRTSRHRQLIAWAQRVPGSQADARDQEDPGPAAGWTSSIIWPHGRQPYRPAWQWCSCCVPCPTSRPESSAASRPCRRRSARRSRAAPAQSVRLSHR